MESKSEESRHHRIDYIEISVLNLEEAKHFYGKVFAWEFIDYSPGYAGIKGEPREMGGLCQAEEIVSGSPLVVLYSDALEETLKAVSDAGGRISKEIFSFPGGRRFEFSDSSGNILAVWTNE